MSAKNILLWVSCLAMAALAASCSGQAGSPIQGDLNAASGEDQDYYSSESYDSAEMALNLPGLPDPAAAGEEDRAVSYTPGLPSMIGPGITLPSVLNYGWKGGMVTDMASPTSVWLMSNTSGPIAWNAYALKEVVPGSLKQIKLMGYGKNLVVYLYNWNAPSWTNMGVFNLSAASPAVIPVPPPYAPNGTTYMILMQLPVAETFITGMETQVF